MRPTRSPTIAWLRFAWGVAYTVYLGTESSMTEARVTIGHIAREAGVNVETVRYRVVLRGLVAECDKPHGATCPIIEQLENAPKPSLSSEQRGHRRGDADIHITKLTGTVWRAWIGGCF